MFWTAAPVLKYHQKTSNSIFLGSLASAFHSIGHKRSVPAILNFIEESLTLQTNKFRNRIHFSNNIMTNIMHIIGEQRLKYNLNLLHKKDVFEILKNVSEYVTLVQLMDSLGNVNHAISIVRYWIFHSNYKKALFLKK